MENVREIIQIMTRRFGLLNKNCCSRGGVELSVVQNHILYEVDRRDHPSMQEVADILGIDITTFSRQIQTLVNLKLLKKTTNAEDRRVSQLSLTAEGKYAATVIDTDINDYLSEIFSHMNEFEKETVIRSIKLLNECMAKSKMCCTTVG